MKDSDTHSSIFTYVLAVADEPRNVCRIKLLPFYETPPKKKVFCWWLEKKGYYIDRAAATRSVDSARSPEKELFSSSKQLQVTQTFCKFQLFVHVALIKPASKELPKNSVNSLSFRMQILPLNTMSQHLGSVWILKSINTHTQAIQVS